jgi:ABC-type sugar transport system substrate-binding protein
MNPETPDGDPQGTASKNFDRRNLLRSGALGAAVLGSTAALSACSFTGGKSLSAAATSGSQASGPISAGGYDHLSGKKIGLVGVNLAGGPGVTVSATGSALAEKYGFTFNALDAQGDYKKASDTIRLWASQDYDAVMIMVIDPSLIQPGLKALNAKKIPSGGVFAGYGPGLTFDSTANEWISGNRIATYLHERLISEGGGSAALISYSPSVAINIRHTAVKTYLDYFKVPIVADVEVVVPGQIPDVKQKVANLLTKYPAGSELKAIFCGWDEIAVAAADAIRQADRDDVFVVSCDGSLNALAAIGAGGPMAATISNDLGLSTDVCIQQFNTIFGGGKPLGASVYFDAPLVTKNNLPPAGQYATGAGLTVFYTP